MAATVNVAGAVLIKTGTGSADALESLGYTINGARITENAFMSDVPGDEKGGNEGPPIDIQYFGQTDIIRLEMSKYDAAVYAKLVPILKGGTAGSAGTAGTLLFSGTTYFRLLLTGANFTRNYLRAVLRNPKDINCGTKFSTLMLEFECHADGSGVLWNTTTTG